MRDNEIQGITYMENGNDEIRHAINLAQRNFIGIPIQRHIFNKISIKKLKNIKNCLENHTHPSHIQVSLVATIGSYGLQESDFFTKRPLDS